MNEEVLNEFMNATSSGMPLAGIISILSAVLFFVFVAIIVILIVYIYSSFAYMRIAKKLKVKNPGLAWIPFVGKPLISVRAAKMDWWPILFLIGVFVPYVGFACLIAFTVFFYIWRWKMFEAAKKPGWWVLLKLIPFVGDVIFLVFLGIIAWGDKK